MLIVLLGDVNLEALHYALMKTHTMRQRKISEQAELIVASIMKGIDVPCLFTPFTVAAALCIGMVVKVFSKVLYKKKC